MRKIKIIITYIFALTALFITVIKPDQLVNQPLDTNKDNIIIYVLKNEELIPITLKHSLSNSIEDNIKSTFELMKQGIDSNGFKSVVPKSLQLLNVNIENENVNLDFNEAIYTINSKYELRMIEAIVNSILQFNDNYKVNFLVNSQLIENMPLSKRNMNTFDKRLGINNFDLEYYDLYSTDSKSVVKTIEEEYTYHVIYTLRISNQIDLMEFINSYLVDSNLLYCEEIEYINDVLVMNVNENFLFDENTIDQNKIMNILYSLKLNGYSDKFMLKVNDEIKTIQGYFSNVIEINDLYLNIFEQK